MYSIPGFRKSINPLYYFKAVLPLFLLMFIILIAIIFLGIIVTTVTRNCNLPPTPGYLSNSTVFCLLFFVFLSI